MAERPDSMNIFLKRESRREDAQYCQPCGHSPGSRALLFGGLLPSRKTCQLGLHQNPTLSSKLAACLSSPTHPFPGPGSSNWRTTSTATSGVRSPIIFNASLQDAQYAAGAQRSADRSPSPPMRIGNVDNCLDSTSSWLGIPSPRFQNRGPHNNQQTDWATWCGWSDLLWEVAPLHLNTKHLNTKHPPFDRRPVETRKPGCKPCLCEGVTGLWLATPSKNMDHGDCTTCNFFG